jgi:hypothetical protein
LSTPWTKPEIAEHGVLTTLRSSAVCGEVWRSAAVVAEPDRVAALICVMTSARKSTTTSMG